MSMKNLLTPAGIEPAKKGRVGSEIQIRGDGMKGK